MKMCSWKFSGETAIESESPDKQQNQQYGELEKTFRCPHIDFFQYSTVCHNESRGGKKGEKLLHAIAYSKPYYHFKFDYYWNTRQ